MIAYKVVSPDESGNLWSTTQSEYKLKYTIGAWVVPKIGKLFVFTDPSHALHFMMGTYYKLFECQIGLKSDGVPDLEAVGQVAYLDSIQKYWTWKQERDVFQALPEYDVFQAPCGTFLTSKVKLLREYDHTV